MTTVEYICNQALDEIGYPHHIGNIYEGTKAARLFLNIYAQTRDVVLETVKPVWARKEMSLTLLKSAPNIVNGTANYTSPWTNASPELPWLYEYTYPLDCLVPLQIKSSPFFLPEWRPRQKPFRLNYDATGMVRTVLTNEEFAILNYVARITNPDNWDSTFTQVLISALARKAEPELMPQRAMARRQQQQQQDADNAS